MSNGSRSTVGISSEVLSAAEKINYERRVTAEHREALERERRVGQFTIGGIKTAVGAAVGAFAAQGADILTKANVLPENRILTVAVLTAVGGVAGGFLKLRERREVAEEVDGFTSNQPDYEPTQQHAPSPGNS